MPFDTETYQNELISLPNCVAHPDFIQSAGWGKDDTGHVLVSKSTDEALIGIVVGKVSPSRLQCGPSGDFRADSKFNTNFHKAKFKLTLDIADEPVLVPIFTVGVSNLSKIQKSASITGENRNLLEGEGDLASIQFGAPIFEKRVSLNNTMIHINYIIHVFSSNLMSSSTSHIWKTSKVVVARRN
jgi:hypothetical protein